MVISSVDALEKSSEKNEVGKKIVEVLQQAAERRKKTGK